MGMVIEAWALAFCPIPPPLTPDSKSCEAEGQGELALALGTWQ